MYKATLLQPTNPSFYSTQKAAAPYMNNISKGV